MIISSKLDSWTFTYNINYRKNEEMKESDYDPILALLNSYGKVTSYVFETGGKQNRLHVHGIVQIERKFVYPNFLKFPRSVYRMKKIFDLRGWKAYMVKDQKLRDDMHAEIEAMRCDDMYEDLSEDIEDIPVDDGFVPPNKKLF